MSCVAGSTLISSCARNGIPNMASEFASGAIRRSVAFSEVQFFEGILILLLIFSLLITPVGWNAWPMRMGGQTGRCGRLVRPATLGEIVLTEAPVSIKAGALASATLTGMRIVGMGLYGENS